MRALHHVTCIMRAYHWHCSRSSCSAPSASATTKLPPLPATAVIAARVLLSHTCAMSLESMCTCTHSVTHTPAAACQHVTHHTSPITRHLDHTAVSAADQHVTAAQQLQGVSASALHHMQRNAATCTALTQPCPMLVLPSAFPSRHD